MKGVIDINIETVEYDIEHIFLRAKQDGKVELTDNTIQVADRYKIQAGRKISRLILCL